MVSNKKRKLTKPKVLPQPQTQPQPMIENPIAPNLSDSAKVTECIRAFNKCYLHFVQEEEKRCGTVEKGDKKKGTTKSSKIQEEEEKPSSGVEKKKKKKKKNNKKAKKTIDSTESKEDDVAVKKTSKRPDLKAVTEMRKMNAIIHSTKMIGPIPGIEVGHQFFSRAEMVVVGFHSHWLNGIDFIGDAKKPNFKVSTLCDLPENSFSKFPITIAIVVSGQYEDDLDKCEELVYTGQGGNNLLGDKRQYKDQEMKRGNLGLKNCHDQSVPIRVIRGHKCQNSYAGKVYTYDGLYKVSKYWAEKGKSGFTVYKFRLKRCEGQPALTTDQVFFTRTREPVDSNGEILGLVCKDISDGLESIPIVATNRIDDPPVAPSGFKYSQTMVVEGVDIPSNAPGCNCIGKCVDPRVCACAKLNGCDFPYVQRDGGRLIEPKDIIFECNPSCRCGPSCVNRTSVRELQYRFEVFRTLRKGWGVRSWDCIPSGAPICEYIGVLKKTDEVDHATENCYIFDIDCVQTMKGLDGRQRRSRNSLPTDIERKDEHSDCAPEYYVDAGSIGNFARFINHSCEPNLFVQCILSTHHDVKLARIVLIAADNIPPLKELTYDYCYALDSVVGSDGNVMKLECSCGALGCRKRLF